MMSSRKIGEDQNFIKRFHRFTLSIDLVLNTIKSQVTYLIYNLIKVKDGSLRLRNVHLTLSLITKS